MAGNGNTKRERLALLVAGGMSVRQAAAKAGVGLRTAHRWSAEDADFQRRVAELRGTRVRRAVGRISAPRDRAVGRVREVVASADERVALGACRAVLELRTRLHEAEELDRQLRALEERAAAGGQTP